MVHVMLERRFQANLASRPWRSHVALSQSLTRKKCAMRRFHVALAWLMSPDIISFCVRPMWMIEWQSWQTRLIRFKVATPDYSPSL